MLAWLEVAEAFSAWHWIALAFWAITELLVVIFVWRVVAGGGVGGRAAVGRGAQRAREVGAPVLAEVKATVGYWAG
jgi:hypothetical protein